MVLCNQALNPIKDSFETRVYYKDYVDEAKYRNLQVNDCREVLHLPIYSPDVKSRPYASIAPDALCSRAVSDQNNSWDTKPFNSLYVEEAKVRKLTVESCIQVLNSTNPSAVVKSRPYASIAPDMLCRNALASGAMNSWDSREFLLPYVDEAKARGFTVEACRQALGIATKGVGQLSRPYINTNSESICRSALSYYKDSWDGRPQYFEYVNEAKSRGLTVDECRRIIDVLQSASSPQARPYQYFNSNVVCRNALSTDKNSWDNRSQFLSYVDEVKARNLTVDDCKQILNLDNSTYDPKSRPYATMSPELLCQNALASGTMNAWETRPQFLGYVQEAQARNITVDTCRQTLGLALQSQGPASIKICNKTSYDLSLVLVTPEKDPQFIEGYWAEGWWSIRANQCDDFTYSNKDDVFYYAKTDDPRYIWSGNNYTCIPNDNFSKISISNWDPASKRCPARSQLRGFIEYKISGGLQIDLIK